MPSRAAIDPFDHTGRQLSGSRRGSKRPRAGLFPGACVSGFARLRAAAAPSAAEELLERLQEPADEGALLLGGREALVLLEQLPLLPRELLRHLDHDGVARVAAATTVEAGHALAAESQH